MIWVVVLVAALPALAKETKPGNGDLELARRLEAAFEKVAEHASESVVVITTSRKAGGKTGEDSDEAGPNPFEGTPFERFFRRGPRSEQPEPDSQGSGIIVRDDGFILTNNHVINGADKVDVRLKDGTKFENAKVIGVDERTDIAVVKVDAKNLHAAQLGNSDAVKVGQWAIAIGTPYELDYSFTVGFVSAKGRSAVVSSAGSAYEDYIQTDAAINPGNSGGPLCDIEGRVIGINTLIKGLNRGIGFAIPINMAREVADQLIDKGKVTRPWIGISIEPLSENKELAEALKNVKDGVVVRTIHPDTPAAKSDLKPADVIVAVDGTKVKTPRDLQLQILRKGIGKPVSLEVIRDGKPVKVALQTGELPDEPLLISRDHGDKPSSSTAFGLTVQTLTKDLAKRLDLDDIEGVVVTEVAEGSLAQQKGLQHGDVITEVDRQPVRSVEEFQKALDAGNAKKGVLLYVRRAGTSTFVVLKEAK